MALSKEAVTIGHILQIDTQNKLRLSTDAHRHSLKLWQFDAETLGKEPGVPLLLPRMPAASLRGALQNKY